MEESTELHMETDVSSTTEDVPETQEVTGSHDGVETVIVVEKLSDEDVSEKTEKESNNDDKSVEVSESSPPADTTPQVTESKLPNKDTEPQKSTQPTTEIPESLKNEITNNTPVSIDDTANNLIEPDIIDSTSKTEKSPNIVIHEISDDSVEGVVLPPDKNKPKDEPPSKDTTPMQVLKDKDICESDKPRTPDIPEIIKKVEPVTNIAHADITETSNDSQLETNSDISEKEHSKSISRELKSLINSAKESKIISECTQLTSKTRKSRTALDNSNTSLNSSLEPEKIKEGVRRNSNNSQKSSCSEKSEKVGLKRSMRSQNPEFVSKVKQFLNSVTGKTSKDEEMTDDEADDKTANKNDHSTSNTTTPKKRKLEEIVMNKSTKLRSDSYCWRCHWAVEQSEKTHVPMLCTVCPRSFHFKCLSGVERNKINSEKSWVCPDCLIVLHAESSETRSHAMKKISLGMLCELLNFALERMMDVNGVEPFLTPVDRAAFPDYDKYVVHPMDLSQMNANIANGLYGSTEAFLGDAQWILHNSIIFNTLQSKLTGGARALVRSCRAEMGEIEACPECYAAAHARRPTWFTDVCSSPHILLWAKLKGFPYWPAKGMSVSGAGMVDVRFFGAHDRAWVPAKDCFLYSEKDPNNFRTKRQDILDSMQEAEQHIRNISRKYGKFVYPPFKTQFEPQKLNEQLKMMIPTFEGEIRVPVKQDKSSNGSPSTGNNKSRSNSKSRKSSVNDSDISETEDPLAIPDNKKDNSISEQVEDFSTETQAKIVEVDISKTKDKTSETQQNEAAKKRRHSHLEEAIITIMDNYAEEKRKKIEDNIDVKKAEEPDLNRSRTRERHKKIEKPKDNLNSDASENNKMEEASSSTPKEKSVVAPLKISLTAAKNGKQTGKVTSPVESPKPSTSNDRSLLIVKSSANVKEYKPAQSKQKPRIEKSLDKSKDDKTKSEKRRNSKSNRPSSANSVRVSSGANVAKIEKPGTENKNESLVEPSTSTKEKTKEHVTLTRTRAADVNKNDKNSANSSAGKDHGKFDDDTSLAVLTRGTESNAEDNSSNGLPTISSVRSLSTVVQSTSTTATTTTTLRKSIEVPIEANPDSSIFTPTSTDTIRTLKDATSKLQKLRADTEPLVGKVGVRAFARMTSPEKDRNDEVQVEIKAEPIDLDDADRHMEKMDLMNAFKLRPVNPPSNLREVRINEVVITPLNRRAPTKVPEIRPRAKKTFPHPKKPEDGQLNGKNSMVYIPIQPPMTQAPLRQPRPNIPIVSAGPRPVVSINNNTGTIVNTMTTPLVPLLSSLGSPSSGAASSQSMPTIGQVPTTVHTVPLMTSVNGQWMFSLQPVMSVGGVDSTPSPPLLNGVSDRGATLVQAAVMSPATPSAPSAPAPCTPPAPLAPPVPPTPPIPHTARSPPVAIATAPPHSVAIAPAPTTTLSSQAANNNGSETNAPGEPPRLQQRPLLNPFDPNTPVGILPTPSSAGSLTAKLNQNAVKLTDFFRTLLEDSLERLDEPVTQAASLRLQLEQARWKHQQQLEELKHNHELTIAEMRASFEKDKARAVSEARRLAQLEQDAAVKLAKSKQWCANCRQESQYYCCWNTSYCDYPCQRAHWSQHFSVCMQKKSQNWIKGKADGSNQPESRLQPKPDNLPKSTAAPNVTVGGKLAAQRPFAHHEQNNAQKTSIIMSMVEDNSGNQTMKCLGTYTAQKSVQATPPPVSVASLIVNKQLMGEDASKRIVTSGGYLIMSPAGGQAPAGSGPPSRRVHTIQYYS